MATVLSMTFAMAISAVTKLPGIQRSSTHPAFTAILNAKETQHDPHHFDPHHFYLPPPSSASSPSP